MTSEEELQKSLEVRASAACLRIPVGIFVDKFAGRFFHHV